MKPSFSMKEYAAYVTASADHVALQWLALAGLPLTSQQKNDLEQLLAKFFLTTKHNSFRHHRE